MLKKRRPPIAKNLLKNSVSGMFAAIEIHNKPVFQYRYEVVVLLVINSWELLLKSYLHKYTKTKIRLKDGTSKPFTDCLNIVESKLGKDFLPTKENLNLLYVYRNKVAHFYSEKLDVIIFSLLKKSLLFYDKFVKTHFGLDISDELGIVMIPIGFKKFYSPLDFLTNESALKESSADVKDFIKEILESSAKLDRNGIDEPVIMDFRMNLTNVNRIKNADIIAGIDNSKKLSSVFTVLKKSNQIKVTLNTKEVVSVTRDRTSSQGVLLYEELSNGIFDEINNIVDANRILAKGESKFMLGQTMYFRIYAERQFINFNTQTFELLARAALFNFYAPCFFWISRLPADTIKKLFDSLLEDAKSPNIMQLVKSAVLLGNEVSDYYYGLVNEKYGKRAQAPQFYYTFGDIRKYNRVNSTLKALKATPTKKLSIGSESFEYKEILNDPMIGKNALSSTCMDIYNGDVAKRSLARELDFLSYSEDLKNKGKDIIRIIKSH